MAKQLRRLPCLADLGRRGDDDGVGTKGEVHELPPASPRPTRQLQEKYTYTH